MKQIAIRKEFSYFLTESDEIESGEFDEKLEKLGLEIEALLGKYGLQTAGNYTAFYGLEKYSVCNCEKCNSLMVNRDKNPTGFSENDMILDIENVIVNGGGNDGKLLCEECLPVTHRWGLHS